MCTPYGRGAKPQKAGLAGRIEFDAMMKQVGFIQQLAENLIHDHHLAEDVTQKTCLETLYRPPKNPQALRSWLRRVIRNLVRMEVRDRKRRTSRDRKARRHDPAPTPPEILARKEMALTVSKAVLKLRDPYRSTILLRFHEQMSLRDISLVCEVSLETVHTRLRRALAQLRCELDRIHGDQDRTWLAALACLASEGAPTRSTDSSFRIVHSVSLRVRWGVAISLGMTTLLFLVLQRVLWRPPNSGTEPMASNRDSVLFQSESRFDRQSFPESSGSEAEETSARPRGPATLMPPLVRPLRARLRGQVFWSDGTSAAGIRCRLVSEKAWEENYLPSGQKMNLVTDEEGFFVIEEIEAKPMVLILDRMRDMTRVSFRPAETIELRVTLPKGVDCHGLVRDAFGEPVPGASVFLCTGYWWSDSGVVVAETGGEGRFRIRDLTKARFVGARAPGYAPSDLVHVNGLNTTQSVNIELTLPGPGAELSWSFLHPDGRPAVGASVIVDDPQRVEDPWESGERFRTEKGRMVSGPPALRFLTDHDGRFRCRGATPGEMQLFVFHPEAAPFVRRMEVRPGPSTETIILDAPVVLNGTVRDSQGAPVSHAKITVKDASTGRFRKQVQQVSDSAGRFQIKGLAPGALQARIQGGANRGTASVTLRGVPGSALVWNVILDEGLTILGTLVDERGEGLSGWTVEAWAPYLMVSPEVMERATEITRRPRMTQEALRAPIRDLELRRATTSPDGRFKMTNLGEIPHRVQVYGPSQWASQPCVRLEKIVPGSGPLFIQVQDDARPSAFISGSVSPVRSDFLKRCRMWAFPNDQLYQPTSGSISEEGAFVLGPLPTGKYVVSIEFPVVSSPEASRHQALGDFSLQPGETRDLGTVALARTGSLRARAHHEEEENFTPPVFLIRDTRMRFLYPCRFDRGAAACSNLPPDDYFLCVKGVASSSVAAQAFPFSVVAGKETFLDVKLRRGRPCQLRLREHLPMTASSYLFMEICDRNGGFVLRDGWRINDGLFLLPGRYRIKALMNSGHLVEATLLSAGPDRVFSGFSSARSCLVVCFRHLK